MTVSLNLKKKVHELSLRNNFVSAVLGVSDTLPNPDHFVEEISDFRKAISKEEGLFVTSDPKDPGAMQIHLTSKPDCHYTVHFLMMDNFWGEVVTLPLILGYENKDQTAGLYFSYEEALSSKGRTLSISDEQEVKELCAALKKGLEQMAAPGNDETTPSNYAINL